MQLYYYPENLAAKATFWLWELRDLVIVVFGVLLSILALTTTRHEDNLPLSKYGARQVLKIGQLHHDHNFEKKYLRGFRYGYRNLDVLCLLTPQLFEWRPRYED